MEIPNKYIDDFKLVQINKQLYFRLVTQQPGAYPRRGLQLFSYKIGQREPGGSFNERRTELQLGLYFATKQQPIFNAEEEQNSPTVNLKVFYSYSKLAALLGVCELLGEAVQPALHITGVLPTAGYIASKREENKAQQERQQRAAEKKAEVHLVNSNGEPPHLDFAPVDQETLAACLFINKKLQLRGASLFDGLYNNLPDGYALPAYCYGPGQWTKAATEELKTQASSSCADEADPQPDLFAKPDQAPALRDYFPLWFDLGTQYAGHNNPQDTTGSAYWNLYILAENLSTGKLEMLPRRVTTAAHRGSLLLTLPLLAKIAYQENKELLQPAMLEQLQDFYGTDITAFKEVTIKGFYLPEQMYFDKGQVSVAATQDGLVDVLVNKDKKMHLRFYCYNLDAAGNKIQPEYEPALFNFATHDVFRAAITWLLDNPSKDPTTPCSCLMSRFVQLVHVLKDPEPKYRINQGKKELSPRWADVYRAIDWLNARRVDITNNPDFNELIDAAVKKQYSNPEEQLDFKNRIYDFLGRNTKRDAMLGTYFDEDKDGNEIIVFKTGPLANKLYLLTMLLGQNGKIDTPLLQEPTQETGALAFSYSTEERELVTQLASWFMNVKTTILSKKILIDNLFKKAGIQPKKLTTRQRSKYLEVIKAYLEERKAANELASYEIKAGKNKGPTAREQKAHSLTLIFDENSKRAERERKAIINADRRKKRQVKKVEKIEAEKQKS